MTDTRLYSTTIFATALALTLFAGSAANAADFTIRPIDFLSGSMSIVATGTITTAGATSTITDWNLTVTTHELLARYTRSNTTNFSSGVSSNGHALYVATSADGSNDGGSLFFRAKNPLVDFGVAPADFTSPFLPGGQAFYMAGVPFDFLDLNQPNGSLYLAATANSADPKIYDLTPLAFGGAIMSGTITTDGKTGALGAVDITNWNIAVEQTTQDVFNSHNSSLLSDQVALNADGNLTVNNPGGYLTFSKGYPGHHPYALTLADFTDAYAPYGQAGYFQGALGATTIDLNAPLGAWPVTGPAPAVPEPATIALFAAGVAGLFGRRALQRGRGGQAATRMQIDAVAGERVWHNR
jgi:hypothetical protein